MNYKILLVILSLNFGMIETVQGQLENGQQRVDPVEYAIEKLNSEVGLPKRIKISGYIHAQYQVADSEGIDSYAGGTSILR